MNYLKSYFIEVSTHLQLLTTLSQVPLRRGGDAAIPEPERRREERLAGCERADFHHVG